MKKNEAYALAAEELSSDKKNAGLWAQAFAKASGKDGKAKSIYIKLRAKQLIREHSFTCQLLHKFTWFWCLSIVVTVAGCLWITFLAEKQSFLNSNPVLKMKIPERASGPNQVVAAFRDLHPNDSRSDDDLTTYLASAYPDIFNQDPNAVSDYQRIQKNLALQFAPQFRDVFNLNGISGAFGRSFATIAIPTLIASISRRMSKIKPIQFISVWLVAWLLLMSASIMVNLQTH
jgi:hypothetical protein